MNNYSGFLVIDKPVGITSFDVIRQLRRIAGVKKMGHGGILDKLASGVLVIGIGKATKDLGISIKCNKSYEAMIKLGATSVTYDSEGPIQSVTEKLDFDLEEARKACANFSGEIQQMPPLYSAKKVAGKRASDIVRKGGTVILEPRKIQIYRLEIKDFDAVSKLLSISVECSSGTYIRSLAHDIGEKLGCGGYLFSLRRTKVGRFGIKKARKLDNLKPENWHHYLC